MSLNKYNEKRNFTQTAEPKGKLESSKNEHIFVVQKHAATNLHYDFRLEIDGTLKSWAVPKGPSLDPNVRRLAILVEDHPYSYKDFEGTIPKGNYGAGNVIVWDNGSYSSNENLSFKEEEQVLINGFQKGHLSFILHGKKLTGKFSLVQLKGKQENAWLLVKKDDESASLEDVLHQNSSVLSGRTLEQLMDNDTKLTSLEQEIGFVSPMLASSSTKPFDDADWIYEKKFDGYRTLAVIENGKVDLYSRNKKVFTTDFKAIADDLKIIDHNIILDGEVVVEDKSGKSNFQMLQNFLKTGQGELKFYVFDILNLDNNDLTNLKLLERKELLQIVLQKFKLLQTHFSNHIVEKGIELFEKSKKLNEEGIMAKKADSLYHAGRRSTDWLKIKNHLEEDAVIVGITVPKDRNYFGALLLGQYKNGKLQYIGKCGSGFSENSLKDLYQGFEQYFTKESALNEKVTLRETIQWLRPHYICSVKFAEWTADKRLRHPVFQGIRADKNLENITVESNSDLLTENTSEAALLNKPALFTESNLTAKIGKQSLLLTNLNKIYFPEDGVSKGEIIHYYSEVAEFILPYLKDRPQSLNRFPNGINSSSFYQKDFDTQKIPSWLTTKKVQSDGDKAEIDYLICNDKETLIYMVNLGCIDFNPWNSTIQNLDNPDWIVIDIDPDKDDFEEVIITALAVRKVLENLEVESYCKTSGASGMHVYIPLAATYNYESVKLFAQLIARDVQTQLPDITTLERSIKKRNHKIYIDYLQNRRGQTIAAPYCIRPVKGATVSTPLDWSEVHAKLRPTDFTIKNVKSRFDKKGDIWKPVLGKGIDINKIIANYR